MTLAELRASLSQCCPSAVLTVGDGTAQVDLGRTRVSQAYAPGTGNIAERCVLETALSIIGFVAPEAGSEPVAPESPQEPVGDGTGATAP